MKRSIYFFIAGAAMLWLAPQTAASAPSDSTRAVLCLYRLAGSAGARLTYDVYLGSNAIARASSGWRETITLRAEGPDTLWARIDAAEELPMDIRFGQTYYIRCSVVAGAQTSPHFEQVDAETAQREMAAIGWPKRIEAAAVALPVAAPKLSRFRIHANAGWGLRTGRLAEGVDGELRDYINRLRSGFQLEVGGNFYFNNHIGVGLVYYEQITSKSLGKSGTITFTDGFSASGELSNHINIRFVGPVFASRNFNAQRTHGLVSGAGIGYVGYSNRIAIDDIKIWEGGSTLGLYGSIGYDFMLSEHVGLGIQLSLIVAVVPINSHQRTINGFTETHNYNEAVVENLSQLALSVGLRFN